MAHAAFAVRSGEETPQRQVVCLDDLVPADDDLRRIEALVDWGQVRRTAEPFYRPGGAGRPALDPAVLVRLARVLAWQPVAVDALRRRGWRPLTSRSGDSWGSG